MYYKHLLPLPPLEVFKKALKTRHAGMALWPLAAGPLPLDYVKACSDAPSGAVTLREVIPVTPLDDDVFEYLLDDDSNRSLLYMNTHLSDRQFKRLLQDRREGEKLRFARMNMTLSKARILLEDEGFVQGVRQDLEGYTFAEVLLETLKVIRDKPGPFAARLLSLKAPAAASFLLQKDVSFTVKARALKDAYLVERLIWLSSDEGLTLPLEQALEAVNAPWSMENCYRGSAFDDRMLRAVPDLLVYLLWRRPELVEPLAQAGSFLSLEALCRVPLTPAQQERVLARWPSEMEAFRLSFPHPPSLHGLMTKLGDSYAPTSPGPVVLAGRPWATKASRTEVLKMPEMVFSEAYGKTVFAFEGYPWSTTSIPNLAHAAWSEASPDEVHAWLYDLQDPALALFLRSRRDLGSRTARVRSDTLLYSEWFWRLLKRDKLRGPTPSPSWLSSYGEKVTLEYWQLARLDLEQEIPAQVTPPARPDWSVWSDFHDRGLAFFLAADLSAKEWDTLMALHPHFEGTVEELLTAVKELS